MMSGHPLNDDVNIRLHLLTAGAIAQLRAEVAVIADAIAKGGDRKSGKALVPYLVADPDARERAAARLIGALALAFGKATFTTAGAFAVAAHNEDLAGAIKAAIPSANGRKLGKLLKKYAGRVVNDLVVERQADGREGAQWRIWPAREFAAQARKPTSPMAR